MNEVYTALKDAEGIDQSDVADLAIAILQEEAKDQRTEEIGRQRGRQGGQTQLGDTGGDSTQAEQNWRDDPATDAQKKALENLGVDFDQDLTKGEASHLIDQAKAQHQAEA
jgi:hypothetical protein